MNDSGAILTGPAQTIPFREVFILRAVELKAKTGISIARNMPSLKQLRESYGITARTWAQAAEQMPAAVAARIEQLETVLNA
jgi:hypothetical protein